MEKRKRLDEASLRYKLKREDKIRGKEEGSSDKVVMADLPKFLPDPALTNSQTVYLRKLWTLNYTIDDIKKPGVWYGMNPMEVEEEVRLLPVYFPRPMKS